MPVDIFEFWSQAGPQDTQHPQDREVFSRLKNRKKNAHRFNLHCLPYCFVGPLRTAPVVLLYLSLGFTEFDLKQARTSKGRDWVMKSRAGNQSLPGPDDHRAAWKWWSSHTSAFGNWEEMRDKVAVLDIGAYHSSKFLDWGLLAALPSSRVSIEWAQTVLFPQAIAGERTVICLRSPKYWGLDDGKAGRKYPIGLFAPRVQQRGHMIRKYPLRQQIIDSVRARLKLK